MKKILHVIDSLKMGGAETIMVGILRGLGDYDHIVVTLKSGDDFNVTKNFRTINLNITSKIDYLVSIFSLKKIIDQNKPDIVHAHLFWSTIISRFATYSSVPLISTYHSMLYDKTNIAQYKLSLLLLDRISYRDSHYTIFVSKTIEKLIAKSVGIKKNKAVIYNFVNDKFYTQGRSKKTSYPIRAIAVGNYRKEKNYEYLVKTLSLFSKKDIVLDIYGEGNSEYLSSILSENNIENIALHAKADNIEQKLGESDIFIMASSHEGFGIALAEAMAVGIKIIVSDISVFREITEDYAVYFSLDNDHSLKNILEGVISDDSEPFNIEKLRRISLRYSYSYFISSIAEKYKKIITHNNIR